MGTLTPNQSFNLPTINGDPNIWGGLLNANWSSLDDKLDPNPGSSTSEFLSKLGGTISGTVTYTGGASYVSQYNITGAALDQKRWRQIYTSGLFQIECLDDAGATGVGGYLRLNRSGTEISAFHVLGNPADPTLITVNSGGATVNGNTVITTGNISAIPVDSINGNRIIDATLTTNKYGALSVTNGKIAAGAVTSDKINIDADLDAGGFKITNLASATAGTDALSRAAADARYGRLATSNTWAGLSEFQNGIDVANGAEVAGGLVVTSGGANVTGSGSFTSTVSVGSTFTVTSGGANITGALTTTGAVTVGGGGINVTGAAVLNNATTVNAPLTVAGVVTATNGFDSNASSTIQGDLTLDNVGDSTITSTSGNLFLESSSNVRSSTINSTTTASAANMFVNSTNFNLMRSTSSGKFKTDKTPIVPTAAVTATLALIPTKFRSLLTSDDDRMYLGFYTEDVAAAIPEAVGPNEDHYDLRAVVATLTGALQNALQRIAVLEAGKK